MTRAMISIGILLTLIGTGIFSGLWVDRQCGDMLGAVGDIREDFLAGDAEHGAEKAEALRRDWEDFRKKAVLVLRNNSLADIDRLAARTAAVSRSNAGDIMTELSELERLLSALKTSAEPRLTMIL